MHEFLSPLSNLRKDDFGGSLENRMRLPLRVANAVRQVAWPKQFPLFVRISATDWTPGGWDLPQSIELAKQMKLIGVDLIDCSSGENIAAAKVPVGPGYQVQFAQAIRRDAAIATGAVGMITEPGLRRSTIISTSQADVVLLARNCCRDPYWPLHAAKTLGGRRPLAPTIRVQVATPQHGAHVHAGLRRSITDILFTM